MGRKVSGLFVLAAGSAAAWLFAVRPRTFRKPDMSDLLRYDYAHRGLFDKSRGIPENSLSAIQAALERGYAVSLDVRLTRDGVPVIFGDSRLTRMCGAEWTVENSSFEELKFQRLQGTEESIPSLAAALEMIDGQVPVLLNLHVEAGNYQSLAARVCEETDTYEGVFAVESFDSRLVNWFRENREDYVRGQIIDHEKKSGSFWMNRVWDFFCNSLLLNFISRPDFISCRKDSSWNPSLWLCRSIYRTPSMVWTIRDEEEYEMAKTNGSIVIFETIEP